MPRYCLWSRCLCRMLEEKHWLLDTWTLQGRLCMLLRWPMNMCQQSRSLELNLEWDKHSLLCTMRTVFEQRLLFDHWNTLCRLLHLLH